MPTIQHTVCLVVCSLFLSIVVVINIIVLLKIEYKKKGYPIKHGYYNLIVMSFCTLRVSSGLLSSEHVDDEVHRFVCGLGYHIRSFTV